MATDRRALLHFEHKTRFPNIQDAFGSYNIKRRYLPAIAASGSDCAEDRDVVTHVVVALWSSELLHDLRLHPTRFRTVCPDSAEACAAWWGGDLPRTSTVTSSLVLFDPIAGGRSDRRRS